MKIYTKNTIDLAEKVMKLIQGYSRTLENECNHHGFSNCFRFHLDKISSLIDNQLPITCVLPAFPAKSPNIDKTAGTLPDMGERLALRFLNNLCINIKSFYEPGAEVIICSDGRVFNDLIQVKDDDVDQYSNEIITIIEKDKLTNIRIFSLDDLYLNFNYVLMRETLVKEYGECMENIKLNILNDSYALALFNGIHRFIFEDNMNILLDLSKNKIRDISKIIAYQVIQRSNAWSNYLEIKFPDAVRLSIHPQSCGSKKLGIMLLACDNIWATPWHRIAVLQGEKHVLMKRVEAEKIGAKPVYINDRFSHYAI